MTRWATLVALVALALAGCTVGPDFTRPKVQAPAFGVTPADVASRTYAGAVDVEWWARFGDPELTSLVKRLARQNLDLQAAAERVLQARAQRDIAASQGLPRLNGQGNYQRQRISENGAQSLVEPAPGAPLEFSLFRTLLSASWELDLFGRIRRSVEAANADTEAEVEARHALALSTIADLARTYFQLRTVQAQAAVTRRNLALANDRRWLVRDRFAQGVATTLDVAQADSQQLAVAQNLPTLIAQQASLANALALLLAEPPRTLAAELDGVAGQPPVPPAVPVGLPGEIVRRRPDIREAEARLHAATAQTGVAVANFYPSVTLNGSFGFEGLSAGTLFDWGSRQFMAGPAINLPIFQGGRLRGVLRLREAQQREAAILFRKTVLQAWHDVDNALTNYAQAQRLRVAAAGTRDASRRALNAADQQYVEGVATLINVVVAQEAVLRSENDVAQAQGQMEMRLVELYAALGGGWQVVPEVRPR